MGRRVSLCPVRVSYKPRGVDGGCWGERQGAGVTHSVHVVPSALIRKRGPSEWKHPRRYAARPVDDIFGLIRKTGPFF